MYAHTLTQWLHRAAQECLRRTHAHARPDFAVLDVFLVQHKLLTLEQHFNPKIVS